MNTSTARRPYASATPGPLKDSPSRSDDASLGGRNRGSRSLGGRSGRFPHFPFRLAAILLAVGLAAACQTKQEKIESHEDSLAAAGFVLRPANTPERQDMLARLPPHKFVKRVNGNDVHYVYADPSVCNCLYVGSQQAYGQYRRDQQQKQLANQQQMNAEMYQDAAWNWSAWGPWGPEYGFGYGPRIGW